MFFVKHILNKCSRGIDFFIEIQKHIKDIKPAIAAIGRKIGSAITCISQYPAGKRYQNTKG